MKSEIARELFNVNFVDFLSPSRKLEELWCLNVVDANAVWTHVSSFKVFGVNLAYSDDVHIERYKTLLLVGDDITLYFTRDENNPLTFRIIEDGAGFLHRQICAADARDLTLKRLDGPADIAAFLTSFEMSMDYTDGLQ